MPKKTKDITYYEAVGRRRESSARVRFYIVSKKDKTVSVNGAILKQGSITINEKSSENYFPAEFEKNILMKPIVLTDSADRFVISVHVMGGGKNGQLEAIVHGISRALCIVDVGNRAILKKEGLLTRDSRIRERRKVGKGGKARRKKQSPKR
ncbi:MAG: 30S ribosomal protein S9 [Candidatus Roizmanbacteria bacterium]|nr:30S ribosomal protein S9 [Candidatus Roizmanbacteria bacterium]